MNVKRLFAVDFGASGGKCFAGLFQDNAFSMQEVHRFPHEGTDFFLPDRTGAPRERAHWDDVLLYGNLIQGLKTFRREIGERIDSIGIDTWGADGQLMSADGDMLGKVYCYRDHRLDTMIEQVKARMDARRIYEITGIHFQPFNVSNQLLWLVENRRELLLPGAFFLPIPSLFYFYLGGIRKVDSSWASVTQLMDAKTRRWSGEIFSALGIPPALMPEIVAPGTQVGALTAPLAERLRLNAAPLMAVGSHDTASAFAAAPIHDAREALIISSGTWSLVGKLLPEPITTAAAMDAGISNEGGIGNVRFLKNCMGTWLIQELRRGWAAEDGQKTGYDEISRQAEAAPAFATLINPNDPGFYNPANMEQAIAEFCRRTGQQAPQGRGAYARTVFESLALTYRQINEEICKVCGTRTTTVNIVGGGSRDPLLNQYTADALGLPVVAGPEEATAAGNFMVQAMGLGLIRSMEEAQPILKQAFPIREFKPRNPGPWEAAYTRFQRICEAAKAKPSK